MELKESRLAFSYNPDIGLATKDDAVISSFRPSFGVLETYPEKKRVLD